MGDAAQAKERKIRRARSKEPKACIREAKALELRRQGLSYADIGREVGLSESAAWRAVKRAIGRVVDQIEEGAKEVLLLELHRLDAMTLAYYPKAVDGDEKAAHMVLKIMDRRAKLLGLDAPTRSEVKAQMEVFDDEAIRDELSRRLPGFLKERS